MPMESLILLLSAVVVVEAVVPPQLSRSLSRDDLIKEYFFEGYEYRVIICFLYFVHGVSISLRQLIDNRPTEVYYLWSAQESVTSYEPS